MSHPPRPTLPLLCLASLAWLAFAPPARAVPAERVASGLAAPMFASAPVGDPRLFVVERAGRIRVVVDGVLRPTPFLDIAARVNQFGEGGLLGLAFAPDFAETRAFYVYYTNGSPMRSRVSRFRASISNPDRADPAEFVVLEVQQPTTINHKGGTVAFGPDGMLYLGLGDGGGTGDPLELAQDRTTLLGKLVRIDVSFTNFTDPYRVPADNPFAGSATARPEIWALGLRNPFRFGFDRERGDLYLADVGQNALEEVSVEPAGGPGGRNYGWDVMEGNSCFEAPDNGEPACNGPSLTLPIYEYGRSLGCSITGGTVYRGSQPALRGHYFFADYCSARIWTLEWDGAGGTIAGVVERTAELEPPAGQGTIRNIVGFGEDGAGELLIVDAGGEVFRVQPAPACGNGLDDDGDGFGDFGAMGVGDPGCASESDASERDAAFSCDDGADGDGDGTTDYREDGAGDPGCWGPLAWTEDPQCQDGVENDGEPGLDFDGGASRNGGTPLGPPDPDCVAPWFPERDACGLGFELALGLPLLARWRRARRGA